MPPDERDAFTSPAADQTIPMTGATMPMMRARN